MILDDNRELTEEQKRRVLRKVEERGFACESCDSGDFEVGEALYLGFLFLSERQDAYMVALTCKEPGCESPRTGIRLHELDFLWKE
ncbi:MAG: hypothetical protein M3P49_16030 [Actinomycetota bacterium]|nr:hypothetical protein [Actinomycetota bacterium]